MNKKIIVDQIVKMLKDYEGCEKVIVKDEENDVYIYGYFEYTDGIYNSIDISYSLNFDKNNNLKDLNKMWW